MRYDNGWQRFKASGRTLYHVGQDSWGYWTVREGQYCSKWPPGNLWDCYEMQRLGERFRFVDANGGTSEGKRLP